LFIIANKQLSAALHAFQIGTLHAKEIYGRFARFSDIQGSLTMKWALRSGLLAIFAILLAGNVRADSILSYSLSQSGVTVTFSLPEFPTALNANLIGVTGVGFFATPTNLVINGLGSSDMLEFFSSLSGGGVEDIPPDPTDTPAFNFVGDQLYTGNEAGNDPTDPLQMLGGTSTLFACEDLACKSVGDAPETIAPSVVSTPEPSALLLFGVGLAGLVLLRKRYAVNHSV
jgi:hypothetical protein